MTSGEPCPTIAPPGESTAAATLRRQAVAAGLCFALLGVLLHGEHWIFDGIPKLPDDAYYYFQLARNAMTGLGFSMDGIGVTNGFQPLWMLVLLPIFRLGLSPEGGVCVVIAVNAVILGLLAGTLYQMIARRFSPLSALAALGLLLSPRFINMLINGMESALTALVMALVLGYLLQRPLLAHPAGPRARDGWLGFLLGLLMLSRLDSVFLVLSVALYLLWAETGRRQGSLAARLWAAFRGELKVFWPLLLLVTPYLAANWWFFGSFMPISGALKNSFPHPSFHPAYLAKFPEHVALLALVVLGAVAARRDADPRVGRCLAIAALGMGLHLLNTLFFMRFAVANWHFVTFIPPGVLALAVLLRWFLTARPRLMRPAVALGLILVSAHLAWHTFKPNARYAGDVYVESALWVRDHLPATALMAMHDSGTFSYFSRRRVVNMDGLVNSLDYEHALCENRLDQYLKEHNVRYLVDIAADLPIGHPPYTIVVPCQLDGRTSSITVSGDREVFRSRPYYHPGAGLTMSLMIWELDSSSR